MVRNKLIAGLMALSLPALFSCGGSSSSPAQPAPVPTPSATPVPTPPPLALSVIPACTLAPSSASNPDCTKPTPLLRDSLNAAIDRVISERPELFDFHDIDGGPRILDYNKYMTAVVAAINYQAGRCGRIDAEGEIGLKSTNSFNEQWIIASKAGWKPPAGNWVERKYVGACSPAVF